MKKIKWLIQDVGIRSNQLHRKFDALSYMNEEFSNIGVIAKKNYISGIEDIFEDKNTIYILLSGTKALTLIDNANNIKELSYFVDDYKDKELDVCIDDLKKGMFYDNKKFDQEYYKDLGLPLLNDESIYIPIKDNLNTKFTEDKFIKPSQDLKAFTGGILKAGCTIEEFIKNRDRQPFFIEENAIIAPVKNIVNEYRFFIVNQKVSSYSSYVINGKPQETMYIHEHIIEKAEEYCKLYQPHDIFTMDLALLDNGEVKIVEYNCFNISGVYLCDMVKTFTEIKEYMLSKYN